MTPTEIKSWLRARGLKRRAFLAAVNAELVASGRQQITDPAIGNWLSRGTPAWVDALLPVIEARLANPESPVIYQVTVALSEAEDKKLRRKARGMTTDAALQTAMRVGLEEEFDIKM